MGRARRQEMVELQEEETPTQTPRQMLQNRCQAPQILHPQIQRTQTMPRIRQRTPQTLHQEDPPRQTPFVQQVRQEQTLPTSSPQVLEEQKVQKETTSLAWRSQRSRC